MAAGKSVLEEMAALAAGLQCIPPMWVYVLPSNIFSPVIALIEHGVDPEKLRILVAKRKPGKRPSKKSQPKAGSTSVGRPKTWSEYDYSMVLAIHREGVEILEGKKSRVTQLAALEARCLAQPDMPRREALRFARSLNRRMSEARRAVRK